jgi:hypothetical protein
MRGILIFFSFCFAVLFFGCEPSKDVGLPVDRPRLSTVEGMGVYLSNLPAVRGVEAWPNRYGEGVTITTDHYFIHTTWLEPLILRQVPAFVESSYDAYQRQLPEPVETNIKFKVYLFAERGQWEDFTREFTGRLSEQYLKILKGAYYTKGACVAYNIGRSRTFGVIAHDGWHQFNSRLFSYRLPSWLDEGIATTFESPEYMKTHFDFNNANLSRLSALRYTMANGNFISLRELLTLNPGYVVDDSAAVAAFYAQSHALVRFLREYNYGFYIRRYHNLLLAGLRGDWPIEPELRRIAADRNIPLTGGFNAYVSTELFDIYIGRDVSTIEEQYRSYCFKLVSSLRPK